MGTGDHSFLVTSCKRFFIVAAWSKNDNNPSSTTSSFSCFCRIRISLLSFTRKSLKKIRVDRHVKYNLANLVLYLITTVIFIMVVALESNIAEVLDCQVCYNGTWYETEKCSKNALAILLSNSLAKRRLHHHCPILESCICSVKMLGQVECVYALANQSCLYHITAKSCKDS